MHSADSLHNRYLHGFSSRGEINVIARTYAALRQISIAQAFAADVHDGLGSELSGDGEASGPATAWNGVGPSLVPLGWQ